MARYPALVMVAAGLCGTGCRQILGQSPAILDTDAGETVDADPRFCLGSSPITVCMPSMPQEAVSLTEPLSTDPENPACATYTTTLGGEPDPAPAWCVIAGASISVPAGTTVRVSGLRPLVLVAASGNITIAGTLDLAGHRGDTAGPAGDQGCPIGGNGSTYVSNTTDGGGGGGGGAGGSFGSKGGAGGAGGPNGKGIPGAALPAISMVGLRGGCPGGIGGSGYSVSNRGPGGVGGGAAALLASDAISVTGSVNASGGGGMGGGAGPRLSTAGGGGGGGGGSGGMIVFDAPTISIVGIAFANGGAGGKGGSWGTPGAHGGESSGPSAAAKCVPNNVASGNGGDGSTGTAAGGGGQNSPDIYGGGGGGGGGGGYIWFRSSSDICDSSHCSPTPIGPS